MLKLCNLTVGYGRKAVIEGLNAEFRDGELTCLIGRNGCGKSTLLRTIAGFQRPLSGEVTITTAASNAANDNENATAEAISEVSLSKISAHERSQLLSIVLTHNDFDAMMTVRELVAMGRAPYTGFWGGLSKQDDDIVKEALSLVGISSFAERKINALSDGERQKVMIAKALAQQTPVILLDEPTAFLDHPSKIETMEMLRDLCHNTRKTIILSSHDLEIAERTVDRFFEIGQ